MCVRRTTKMISVHSFRMIVSLEYSAEGLTSAIGEHYYSHDT